MLSPSAFNFEINETDRNEKSNALDSYIFFSLFFSLSGDNILTFFKMKVSAYPIKGRNKSYKKHIKRNERTNAQFP